MDVADLRTRADALGHADRRRFLRRIAGAERIGVRSRRRAVLDAIEGDLASAERRLDMRRSGRPAQIGYPAELPISERLEELAEAIASNQVVIVSGETGSGKSTQIPKLCIEMGRGVDGMIAHTQPRRIAARAVAERIAEELETEIGGVVGFAMRFTDRVGDRTLLKVMTDGLLLAEIQRDPLLLAYDTVIVDEAHERSLNIDFLLGALHRLLPRRPDLRVIVTSATIDTARFSAHFGDAPIVEVSGRAYPVEIRYRPPLEADGEPLDQPDAIAAAVREIAAEGSGDILVFCSGEREIRDAADAIADLRLANTETLPLYARLSSSEQHRVFQRHGGRRIVLATNVAETSLTVPGIRAVVDPGTARISRWSRRTKVQRLPIEPVSRASADQRAGRCGRVGPGICIRLYSEDDYLARPAFTEPEIQRTNLASVLLQMAAAGLGRPEDFPFVDRPDHRAIRDGVTLLEELGAVTPSGDGSNLTSVGRTLARLPVDPRLGRMIVEADRRGCLSEVLVITSALSIIDPRERPTGTEAAADALHARFTIGGSDLLGWLALWDHLRERRRALTSGRFRRLCRDEFINHRRVREWQDVHAQLRSVCTELGIRPSGRKGDADQIHLAILSGLLSQTGRKDPTGHEYRGARGARFSIAPGSAVFSATPEWVMAADLTETTRVWARGVARIVPEWIEEVGSHIVTRSHSDPWWDRGRAVPLTRETVSLFGIPVVGDREIPFGRVDPAGARSVFIQSALVEGDWDSVHAFVARNRARFADVADMEARHRRDLLVDDDTLWAWFHERIPASVVSGGHFDSWWKTVVGSDPHRLDLSISDLVVGDVSDAEAFPVVWRHGDLELPVAYEYAPGSDIDGIVVDVPVETLDRLDPAVFEWHVPGHRAELVDALIRSLPKRLRKQFLPIAETAERVLASTSDGGLIDHLRRELSRVSGETILARDFDLDRLPAHLVPMFRIVASDGSVIAAGADLPSMREELRVETRGLVATASHPLERSGLTGWDLDDLPRTVTIRGADHEIAVHPALVDDGETVSIRLLATEAEQADHMWAGTRRLLAMGVVGAGRTLEPLLTPQAKADLGLGPYASRAEWVFDCLDCAVDGILVDAGGPAWDAAGFDRLRRRVRDDIGGRLEEVGRSSLAVMAALRDTQIAVNRSTGPTFEEAVEDIRRQVVQLVYPGFQAAIGAARLDDVERYLRAIVWRLDRLADAPRRDAEHQAVVAELETRHRELVEALGPTTSLSAVGWMLQELRVSYFAQSLGTRERVSARRVAAALRDAELEL